jgi:sugar lactone lactonase YvrE
MLLHRMPRSAPVALVIGTAITLAATPATADPPSGRVGGLETVVSYEPTRGEFAESVALAADGTVYVSLINAGQIDAREPNGTYRRISLPVDSVGTLALGAREALYASSFTPPALWRIDGAGGAAPAAVKLASLPEGSAPNGITFDRRGNLYAADSNLGVVWRLARRGAGHAPTATMWAGGPLLAVGDTVTIPGYEQFPVPGPNGVKVFRGALYVSNSSTAQILRIPIRRDGSAGTVTVAHDGIAVDDFAFDVVGNIYATTDPFNTVELLRPDGTTRVLLTAADGLAGPSAAAFGTTRGDRSTLYITNLSFFERIPRPSLQRVDLPVPGLPIPLGPPGKRAAHR